MKIEIDMSGKIEQTHLDTIIGLSNNVSIGVILPREIKRKLELLLRGGVNYRFYRYLTFAACVAILLKMYVPEYKVIIDVEYTGHEVLIKSWITTCLLEMGVKKRVIIEFDLVGKSSNAHQLCSDIAHKRKSPTRVITEREIMKLLPLKKIGNLSEG